MERSLATANSLFDLHQKSLQQVQQFVDQIESKINASDLSASEKEEFLQSFRKSYFDSDVFRQKKALLEAEMAWAAATRELYQFSLQHQKQIRVSRDKIMIADGSIRDEFNTRLSRGNDLHQKARILDAQVVAMEKTIFQQAGVSPSDLGLK